MYGKGGAVAGVSSTATGIMALPNTSGNLALTILSVATIVIGSIVTASFIFTRLAYLANR